jgi:YD repeat-containing protein
LFPHLFSLFCSEKLLNGSLYIDRYAYDYIGNKTHERLAYAAARNLPYFAKWEYDYADRVTKAYNADGGYVTNTYNALGQLTSATDLAGTATTYTYNTRGSLAGEKPLLNKVAV